MSFRQNLDAAKAHKEALPLPMAVVAAFERRVSNRAATQWETLVLGSFVAMIWGGLRGEKLQRTCPGSLVVDGNVLRGIAWRSKTSKNGLPFGVWTFGLTSRPPSKGGPTAGTLHSANGLPL